MSALHAFDTPVELETPGPQESAKNEPPIRKTWRLYFNRREDFPFLAAIDNGTIASQIRVQNVRMIEVRHAEGVTDMGPSPFRIGSTDPWERKQEDLRRARKGKHNEPTWWIQFEAIAVFENGGVTFYGE